MKNLEVKGTIKTPTIRLTDSELVVEGRSYPENSVEIYKPIMNRLNEVEQFENFTIRLKLEYCNSSSSKVLSYIIKSIADKTKNEVQLYWIIDEDDEAMQNLSDNFMSIISNVKFHIELIY
jgi:hypothetical protein